MTTPQYLNLNNGGAKARMSILRMQAIEHNRNRPPSMAIDWRGARRYGFHNWRDGYVDGLHQGFNGTDSYKTPIWYNHTGPQFRGETYCDEIREAGIDHTGWFCDELQNNKARGIVGLLTHGRYIAGYELSDSGERVYFDEVFTDQMDAARMADEHARVIAERESEYNAAWQSAKTLQEETETAIERLRECFTLRNNPCFDYARAEMAGLIETIRGNRETLATTYKDIEL